MASENTKDDKAATFADMLPVKSLVRLNWSLALVTSATVFLFLAQDDREKHAFVYPIMTALAIVLIGYIHIWTLQYLRARYPRRSKAFVTIRYTATYLLSAAVYFLIWPVFAHLALTPMSLGNPSVFISLIVGSALVNSLIIIFHNFILLQHDKVRADLELSQLKTAHAEAANLLLKQQIHPHFLFNALHTVKSLYRTNTDQGDSYLVHLANFLRASVSRQDSHISRLDEELSFLNDYLEMQKIRFGSALECEILIPPESLVRYYLLSFSLQPLLENAIKHNELTEEAPLKVTVRERGDRIEVANNLQVKNAGYSSTNHGLANLAERYRLWSGDEIIITRTAQTFCVSIKLLTNEHSDH